MYPRFGILCFVNLTALLASDGFHRGRCCELLPRLLGAHDRSAENQTKHDSYALEDVLISGSTIPRGALVYVVIASANRDERQFENPDTLDITRQNNRHLAFGQGIHYCLGAPLARLETQIAINAILRRFPHLRLAMPITKLRWKKGLVLRGLESLPAKLQ